MSSQPQKPETPPQDPRVRLIDLSSPEGQAAMADRLRLEHQYVVSRRDFVSYKLLALSQTVDDVVTQHGLEIYEKMLHDPDVAAAYWFLVYSVLADDLMVRSAITDEEDPNFDVAQEIADFCNECILSLETPFRTTCEELLQAMQYGHKVSEVTYKMDAWRGKQMMIIDNITILPHKNTAFVTDQFMHVTGLLARRSATGLVTSLSLVVDPKQVIPREKFLILTMRSKEGDPRGMSLFRPAWNGYNFKQQVWPEYMLWLMACAVPPKVGFTSPDVNSTDVQKIDPTTGNPVYDPISGNPIYLSPQEAMIQAMDGGRNGSNMAFPSGAKIDYLESKQHGEPFTNAIQECGKEITKALLMQTLATREGQHQTRAASQTQMTVVDQLVWAIKGILVNAIRNDLFKILVKYNYGEAAAKTLLPIASLGDYERRHWAVDATAAATIIPYCTFSQAEALKTQIGVPEREDNETAADYVGTGSGGAKTGAIGGSGQGSANPSGAQDAGVI